MVKGPGRQEQEEGISPLRWIRSAGGVLWVGLSTGLGWQLALRLHCVGSLPSQFGTYLGNRAPSACADTDLHPCLSTRSRRGARQQRQEESVLPEQPAAHCDVGKFSPTFIQLAERHLANDTGSNDNVLRAFQMCRERSHGWQDQDSKLGSGRHLLS